MHAQWNVSNRVLQEESGKRDEVFSSGSDIKEDLEASIYGFNVTFPMMWSYILRSRGFRVIYNMDLIRIQLHSVGVTCQYSLA